MLDVFKTDPFNMVSLTAAINALPYVPTRLARMGLFKVEPISTTKCVIERQNNKLALVPAKTRGDSTTQQSRTTRKARVIEVPHLPLNDQILAEEVQGVRAFGTEDATETVTDLVNSRLETMKQSLELTKEYHRVGAVQGIVLDADGTTELLNLFTEFDITEATQAFDFTGSGNMKDEAQDLIELIEDALGGIPYSGVRVLCGSTFWKSLIRHASVASAFERQQENSFARTQQDKEGFEFADIMWECYRGKAGGTPFIPATKARAFPEGVPGLFREANAPANFMESVNTMGKPFYAKQRVLDFDLGVALHAQSNPLMYCTMPELLVELS